MDRPNRIPWPPIILIATLIIGFGLEHFWPIGWPPKPLADLLTGLGFFIAIGAIATDIMTLRKLREHDTTVLPNRAATQLVTSGPFSISRNPIYLANMFLIGAIGLLFGNLWLLLLIPISAIATQKLAIEPEERHLKVKFSKAWRAYSKNVRRWI